MTISGSGTHRPGFERLLRALCDGQVGAVFSIEALRLARNGRDWDPLLDFCSVVGALQVVGQHRGAHQHLEPFAAFGLAALHPAPAKEDRDSSLNADPESLTFLELGAAL